MRFTELQITAYGHFTDKVLDLSQPARTLHVVYGPNEAGKSTLKSAIEELLFGYHTRTPFNFKHDYNRLRLGATIQNGAGASLAFVRRKRQTADLCTPEDVPLAAAALAPFLHDLNKDGFQRQFSLDRDDMAAGSQEIADGKGDLGQSLFNAALGNTSLSQIIKNLDAKIEALFAPKAQTKVLNRAISAFEEKRAAVRTALLRPEAWSGVVTERDKLVKEIDTLDARMADLAVTTERLQALSVAYPNYDNLQRKRTSLETYAAVTVLSTDVIADVERLLADLTAAEVAVAAAADRIAELEPALGAEITSPLLDRAAELQQLTLGVSTYRKNVSDLREHDLVGFANRNTERAMQILKRLWPDLPLEQARARTLAQETVAQGNALVIEHATVTEKLATAAAAVKRLTESLADARADLAALPLAQDLSGSQDFSGLRSAVATATAEGRIDADVPAAQAELARGQKALDTAFANQRLYTGSLAAFLATPLPLRETVTASQTAFADLARREALLVQRRDDTRRKRLEAAEQLDTLAKEGVLLTVADLTDARTKRDAIFTELATQWHNDAKPADLDATSVRYQPAVVGADDLSDTLRQNANRLAMIAGHEARRDAADRELAAVQAEFDELATEQKAKTAEWVAEWAALGIQPRSPEEMSAWLQSAGEIRKLAATLDEAADAHQRLEKRRAERLFDVGTTLTAFGKPTPAGDALEPVLALARDFLAASDAVVTKRTALARDIARDERALERVQREKTEAEAALADVMTRWSSILAAAYLPLDTSPSAFAEATSLIAEFHNLAQRARHDRSRADGINRDNRDFTNAVVAFTATCASKLTPVATTTPDAAALALDEELSRLKTARDRRAQGVEQLAREKANFERASAKVAAVEAELAPIRSAHGVERDALAQTIATSKTVHALRDTVAAETAALETATGRPLAECEAAYAGRTRDDLRREISQSSELHRDEQGQRDELNRKRWALDAQLAEMDTSQVAVDAEAAMIAEGAKIDLESRRWAELTAARYILDRQIREYAETHQGPIIERSSEYFARLTDGAYTKLRPLSENDKPVLFAFDRDGDPVKSDHLSKGTRDQLYLALRLAALEEYMKANDPQPLILDDAFVQFDDDRTACAFEALAEFSKTTQVIYFTHHEACVAAAVAGVPAEQLEVHRLASRWEDTPPAA